jgi:hypothetical protein
MPETATRLPRARTTRNPAWLDALDVYKRSFDATSAETLIEGAEAFAEMSPDDQAFHQAHLTFRQVQGLGDIHAVLRRIDARLAGLGPESLAGMKDLPTMKKALVSIARGQNQMLRIVAQGGLSDAVNGDNDDDEDDDDSEEDDDGDDLDGEEDAEVIEDGRPEADARRPSAQPPARQGPEGAAPAPGARPQRPGVRGDHGNGDTEAVVPEALPAGARRPPVETP